ncbi:MobV family relaxase [Burkholderia vietnamiensis]|uniref:MobV family relaxase n=1 Tax=Burkholderia vietnamiensis TaxID=60552 RepID=UPI001BA1FDEB|nr:MobV family relaxase [Burkholderia vietnamiensis]MBR8150492.1 plasmid recombination protein [Burkholderia vietnamiensis]
MNNNILRTEKVKSRAQITQAAEHNFRLRTQNNIDSSRSYLNQVLVNTLGVDTKKSSDLQEKLSAYYKSLDIKERGDSVLMMEFVVSASPEFFEKKSQKEILAWASEQTKFMKNEFGDQLKIAVLHQDEKTPHIHFMIGTEVKSVKKYKNQKGEFFKETWSLNAKRYNPIFLRDLHDRHAEWNKKWNLKRGVRGSMRKHKSLKEFYSMVDKALNADYESEIERVIDSMNTGLFGGVSIDEVREKFKPMMSGVLKQNKALRAKYALEIKEWALDLANREAKLDAIEKSLANREKLLEDTREVYREAINSKGLDAENIFSMTEKMLALEDENKRLKEKYEPSKQTTKNTKGDKNGLHI